jgi:hypothetical protein
VENSGIKNLKKTRLIALWKRQQADVLKRRPVANAVRLDVFSFSYCDEHTLTVSIFVLRVVKQFARTAHTSIH